MLNIARVEGVTVGQDAIRQKLGNVHVYYPRTKENQSLVIVRTTYPSTFVSLLNIAFLRGTAVDILPGPDQEVLVYDGDKKPEAFKSPYVVPVRPRERQTMYIYPFVEDVSNMKPRVVEFAR